ncbi:PIN domain-containing protein [Flavobacterium hydrophilum]|uniref:DUF4935 domain-containing protein n=1 Tax=Flavobacterium hydrophilum TaxID=2211445 RepID=A0A2V4C1Q5_9FLAO|nr:PIN domain-containing protein [Flavobacterium hydrophilum]PXY45246.1 hypothetical protein DMB68_11180 [Flavobacterium hydrophilum]
MTYLMIDTCVWLDLAKTSKYEKLVNLLDQLVEDWEVSLIIPEIVLSEFQNNKDRIVSDAGKNLSSYFEKVRDIIFDFGEEKNKKIIMAHLDEFTSKIPNYGESVLNSLQKIEKLFSQAEIIKTTDEILLKASKRALHKKAPFHLSKNSIGDAIIIESYIEYIIQNEPQDCKFMFVTHNKNDFSLTNGNHKIPHKDIADFFDSTKSFYFINLIDALNEINAELVLNIQEDNYWKSEPRNLTEISEVSNELERKIWYNRHQILANKIKTGKVKIIDIKDYSSQNHNTTIVDIIWETAIKGAKTIEEKYGKENLIWDDFEWGMINGKLSALRWVSGEEWDFLDT